MTTHQRFLTTPCGTDRHTDCRSASACSCRCHAQAWADAASVGRVPLNENHPLAVTVEQLDLLLDALLSYENTVERELCEAHDEDDVNLANELIHRADRVTELASVVGRKLDEVRGL